MQEYRSYASLDDRILNDGDVGFVGFNNRLRPDQLQGGMLADAQNVRFDRNGEAQVRKGIEVIEAPFAVGGDVLRLPTTAEIGNGSTAMLPTTIESANLVGADNKVSIVINDPAVEAGHTFVATDVVAIEGLGFSTVDPNSVAPTSDPLVITSLKTLASVTDNAITVGSLSIGRTYTIKTVGSTDFTAIGASASTIGVTFTATGAGSGTGTVTNTKTLKYDLSGSNESYSAAVALPEDLITTAGNFLVGKTYTIQSVGSTNFTAIGASSNYVDVAFTATGAGSGTGTASFNLNANTTQAVIGFNMVLDQGSVTEVYASTEFSDPNENASQYILIASNLKVVAKNLATNATVDIAYPAGETVPPAASMLQAFNKVFIFRKGQVALEWDGSFSTITSGSFEVGKTYSITSLGGNSQTEWNTAAGTSGVTYAVGSTFTAATVGASGTGTATSAFSKVASGTYTQPVQMSSTVTTAAGKMTVTAGSAHNLSTGNEVIVEDKAGSNLVVGERYIVTVVDSTNFTIFVQHANETNTQNVIFQKQVSVGLGFTHMPAPEFAVYHQRRLVMPFQFSVTGTNSYTSRGIIDEVIASDILDSDTYDQIYAQYRFNAGEADFTVGLHSFSEDNLMVFNRNSIHLISNTTSLQAASTKLLTDEVGCVARQSIQQVGSQVIFLSDNGVYSTQFFDEYNLRGTETPLSEPINETIKRINKDQRGQAVAVYFDNRYFIAVPVDKFRDNRTENQVSGEFLTKADALLAGIPRENIEDSVALRNNVILIYNFLNKQWESVDSVNSTDWDIENLIVAGEGSKRGVYAINRLGGIHKIDSRLQGVDLINVSIGGSDTTKDVKGSITTRQYTFGNMSRKNWKEFQMHVESSADNTSNFDLSAETENPDGTFTLGTLNSFNGNSDLAAAEDVSIRGRIGNRRGHGIQFTVNNTQGRPRIRSLQTQGSTSFRSTQKAE